MVETVAVDGPAHLVPDHVLTSLLLGQADGAGAGESLSPGGWSAADTEAGVRVVLLLLVLEAHLLGPADAPGGDGVVCEEDEEYEYGGVGDPEVDGDARPGVLLSPAVASGRRRARGRSGDVQVVVGLPAGVVGTQVDLDASVPEVVEVLLCRVDVGLGVRGGGDGDPGEPDQVAANWKQISVEECRVYNCKSDNFSKFLPALVVSSRLLQNKLNYSKPSNITNIQTPKWFDFLGQDKCRQGPLVTNCPGSPPTYHPSSKLFLTRSRLDSSKS